MAKSNATTISVMPVRHDPNVSIQHLNFLKITVEEYRTLTMCSAGIKTSECTARQRLVLHKMKERGFTRVVQYPGLFEGSGWVLSEHGEFTVKAATCLVGADFQSNPTKLLQFPVSLRG
jgi:hypothetical protein